MTRRLGSLAALCLLGGSPAVGGALDFNLNDDSARLTYTWHAAEDKLGIGAGWLRQQDDGDVFHVGLHRVGRTTARTHSLEAGLGGRIYYVDADSVDGYVLGLGGFVRFPLPAHPRLVFGGHLYFGPEVVAGGDVEDFREGELRVGYEILEGADVYLGYRYVKSDFEGAPSVTLDDDLHLGLRLRF